MKNIISQKQLNSANLAVTRELDVLGLWDEAISQTETYLTLAGRAYGYQKYNSSGEILIPSISLARLGEKLMKEKRVALRDILRHEFAHAYAHVHPQFVKSREFKAVFGGPHELDRSLEQEYNPARHVTEYAASMPMEDFAEVFMFYVKHKGVCPRRFEHPEILRKWEFVESLPAKARKAPLAKKGFKKTGKKGTPAPQKYPKRLKIHITEQEDGDSCGAHALLALLRYHGWDTNVREVIDSLGVEHSLPMMPGRKQLEGLLDKLGKDLKGTWPVDMFYNLWNHRFTTSLLPVKPSAFQQKLSIEIMEKRPVLGLTYNGSWWHWIVFNGVDNKGAWIRDSLEPDEPRRMEWDEVESDLLGAIAARPREEYLTTVIPRISRFDLRIASRFAKQALQRGR